jgi:hypothetical protein
MNPTPKDRKMDGGGKRSFRAGVGRREITVRGPKARIHDPLYAKALVLDDGRTRAAIVALDAVAIGMIGDVRDSFLPRLRRRIETKLGIPAGNVLVNASHTHPPGRLLCGDAEQLERTFAAVRQAARSLAPARVGSGVGREDRFIINRTLRLKNGRHWTLRHANPCPPDEAVAALGPVDPDIGLLRLDRLDGRPLAVVYNFACHPLIGVPHGRVTANYPGFASKVIEETLGHGALALFLQGAGGDVTEVLYKDVNRPRDAEPLGTMLGLSTLRAWRRIRTRDADLNAITATIDLPRRTDIPRRVRALQREQAALLASLRFTSLNFRAFLPLHLRYALNPDFPADYAYRYLQAQKIGSDELEAMDAENRANLAKYLANIRAMERLARIQDDLETLAHHQAINRRAGKPTIRAEVLGLRIGDCVLITSPAEVLVRVGLNLKRASPYRHTFVAAFSNGYLHYGPPAADYAKGGYEVTECLLGPGWQRLYEAKAKEIIREL